MHTKSIRESMKMSFVEQVGWKRSHRGRGTDPSPLCSPWNEILSLKVWNCHRSSLSSFKVKFVLKPNITQKSARVRCNFMRFISKHTRVSSIHVENKQSRTLSKRLPGSCTPMTAPAASLQIPQLSWLRTPQTSSAHELYMNGMVLDGCTVSFNMPG